MAGVGVSERVRGFVVDGEVEGGVLLGRGVGVQLPVQLRHQARGGEMRAALAPLAGAQLRAHGGLDGGHQQGRRNSLAGHVADGERQLEPAAP